MVAGDATALRFGCNHSYKRFTPLPVTTRVPSGGAMVDTNIIRRQSSASSSHQTAGLPSDIVDRAARRLGALALVVAIASGAGVFGFLGLGRGLEPLASVRAVQLATAVLSLAVFALSRARRFRTPRLLDIGLVYAVAVGFSLAINEYLRFPADLPARGISWVCVWMTAIAILLPAQLWRAAATIVAAGSANVVTLLCAVFLFGDPNPGRPAFMAALLPNVIAAAAAIVIARVVHGLAQDVKQARLLGAYELEEELGHGAMGEVWRARHRMLARPAAVKLIRPDTLGASSPSTAERLRRRFEREARATAALESPHTVELYDYGVTGDGQFYYAMQLLDGVDLDRHVIDNGAMSPADAADVLAQICHSLADAHAAGLVHRDIKPSNLMLTRTRLGERVVKVLDFGLVTAANNQPGDVTHAGNCVGTPAFMAPEMYRSDLADHRSDIYAVGCVGYWLLTGHLVFDEKTPVMMAMRHMEDPVEPPSQLRSDGIPDVLEAIVVRCLAKDPAERPQSAAELGVELRAFVGKSEGRL